MTPTDSPQQRPKGSRKLSEFLSPRNLIADFEKVCRDRPVTVVFATLLTLYALYEIWDIISIPEHTEISLLISLTLGTLLSLAAYQWSSVMKPGTKPLLLQVAVVAFTIINFAVLYLTDAAFSSQRMIGYSAAYTAAVIGIFFIPGRRSANISRLWAYTMAAINALAVALFVAMILSFALSIIYFTLEVLFRVNEFRVLTTAMVLFAGLLPVLIFMRYLPTDTATSRPEQAYLSISALCKNVVLPICAVYMLILYVYGIKILLTWELPKGSVCSMVTGLTATVLAVIYGMQGYLHVSESRPTAKRLATIATHLLPALLLPLLLLMSVAIFYRIGQYGISPSRLYVATFNIWAYGAIAYILLSRLPRLNIVACTFAAVFVAVSIIPGLNYYSIGIRAVQEKVRQTLTQAGAKNYPLSFEEFTGLLCSLDSKTAEGIIADIDNLDDWDNHQDIAPIINVTDSGKLTSRELRYIYDKKAAVSRFDIKSAEMPLSPIPDGFSSIRYHKSYKYSNDTTPEGKTTIRIGQDTVLIPIDSLVALPKTDTIQPVAIEYAPGHIYIMTSFSARGTRSEKSDYKYIETQGYILEK